MAKAEPAMLTVELVFSPAAREVLSQSLRLVAGSRVSDAVAASGWQPRLDALGVPVTLGIWGRKVAPDALLHEGDRVEIYRPLRVDPKVARRERFARQGARSAGLFAQRRPGAKPGY